MITFTRSDFSTLARTRYGIGFHWTTWTAPKKGDPLPFGQAVEAFDVARFVSQAIVAGAGHVLITTTHAMHWLPCPNPEVDRLISGRTCRRDLIMEIADGLATVGIPLLLYYNHGLHGGDPEWREAVGANRPDRTEYFQNCNRVIGWMGEHYGKKVAAWWFDHGLGDFPETPWAEITAAAKTGNPDRLVCYNSGVETHKLHTPFQDYWAGEICRLNYLLREPLTPSGLPWYSFTSWHPDLDHYGCGEWGLNMQNRDLDWPPPNVDSVAAYLERFLTRNGVVTFNLLCYQDGSAYPSDLRVMSELKKLVRQP
jgi:hypothetical protein